jgi:hypothetical protein
MVRGGSVGAWTGREDKPAPVVVAGNAATSGEAVGAAACFFFVDFLLGAGLEVCAAAQICGRRGCSRAHGAATA